MSRIAVPSRAPLEQDPVDRLDRAHVQPAGRLGGDHELRPGVDLTGQDEPLQVAARQEPGLGIDRGRRDVEGGPEAFGDGPGRRCRP